jgi:hypothetical protein
MLLVGRRCRVTRTKYGTTALMDKVTLKCQVFMILWMHMVFSEQNVLILDTI